MRGGKSMKKSVIGSRITTMNSLNKMAPRPRNGRFMDFNRLPHAERVRYPASVAFSLGGAMRIPSSRRFLLWRTVVGIFRGQSDEDIFERRPDDVNLGALDPDAEQLFFDLGPGDGI